jgi:hypothetical protein
LGAGCTQPQQQQGADVQQQFLAAPSDSGFTPLSIQDITYQSTDSEFAGQQTVNIIGVVNNQGGKAAGYISPSLFKQLLGGALKIQGGFTLEQGMSEQSIKWEIQESDEIIYTTRATGGNPPYCSGFVPTGCTQLASEQVISGPACGYNYITLVYSACPTYRVAYPSSTGLYDYVVNVSVIPDQGDTVQGILTANQPTADLGGVCKVKGIGSLVGTQTPPQISQDTVFIRPINGGNYEAHNLRSYASLQRMLYSIVNSGSMGAYNTQLQAFLNSVPPSKTDIHCPFNNPDATTYTCFPSQPTIFPTLSTTCLTDYFKAIVPASTPSIMFIGNATTIFEANVTRYPITIQNIGTEDDSFQLSLTCPIPVEIRSTPIFLKSGEIGTANLEINGFSSKQTCALTASSVNDPALKHTVNLTVEIILRPCPSQLECCGADSGYLQRACPVKVSSTCEAGTFSQFTNKSNSEQICNAWLDVLKCTDAEVAAGETNRTKAFIDCGKGSDYGTSCGLTQGPYKTCTMNIETQVCRNFGCQPGPIETLTTTQQKDSPYACSQNDPIYKDKPCQGGFICVSNACISPEHASEILRQSELLGQPQVVPGPQPDAITSASNFIKNNAFELAAAILLLGGLVWLLLNVMRK